MLHASPMDNDLLDDQGQFSYILSYWSYFLGFHVVTVGHLITSLFASESFAHPERTLKWD